MVAEQELQQALADIAQLKQAAAEHTNVLNTHNRNFQDMTIKIANMEGALTYANNLSETISKALTSSASTGRSYYPLT